MTVLYILGDMVRWIMLLFFLPALFGVLLLILIGLGRMAERFLLWISGAKKL